MTDQQASGPSYRTVGVWNQQLKIQLRVAGSGPPLVYLHAAGGLVWDSFLDGLSARYTVYAPEHPGTSASDPSAINKVDSWWELLMIYEQLVRELGLQQPVVIGQSYGGMMAADLAAVYPNLFSRVVLLDSIGLWRDDTPIPLVELCASGPERLPGFLFHDPACEGAQQMAAPGADLDAALKGIAGRVWALGCTGKFFWPIADYGLAKRLHRVKAPTLIVWGRQDALVPVVYAEEFASRIAGSTVALIDQCGHVPQVEKPQETLERVTAFLGK
jgi:pimeloyl-ACP methyl ester carboxylesterase